MGSKNYDFWKLMWKWGSVTLEELSLFVVTKDNTTGEITKEEFEKITGKKFK